MRIHLRCASFRALPLLALLSLLQASTPVEIVVHETHDSYSARFEARWQLQRNDTAECGIAYAPKRIHCLNGTIANIKPLFDDVNCTFVTESMMECNDTSPRHFVNSFSGVKYDCQGPTFPFTKVEYEATDLFCKSSAAHMLQVSPICDNNDILDSYFECGDSSQEINLTGGVTCQSINISDPNSSPIMLLPKVAMYTNFQWGIDQPEGCVDLNSATSTGKPSLATSAPPLSAPTNVVSDAPIAIPAGTIYSVKYVGRFQQILSEGCIKASPVLILTCLGDIVNVETSDPSIVCYPGTITLESGQNARLCENTCAPASECKDVFLTDTRTLEPMGKIYFECQGDSIDAVDGSFIIDKGTPGICPGTNPDGFNLYLAQLGVSCPSADGGHSYLFDDLHSECGLDNLAMDVGGNYTCFSGTACGAVVCNLDFQQTIINADHHRFRECISTNNGSPVPEVPTPETQVLNPGIYSAQFKATWFFSSDSKCYPNPSLKHAICTNGNITKVESDIPCAVISNTTIECSDAGLDGSLIYECASISEIPETVFRSFSVTTTCKSDSEQLVQHGVQLGINCKTGTEEYFAYMDAFLECGPENYFVPVDNNFTCISSVTVPVSDSIDYPIPDLEILTDFRWPSIALGSNVCYLYQPTQQRKLMSFDEGIHESDNLPHLLRQTAKVLLGRTLTMDVNPE